MTPKAYSPVYVPKMTWPLALNTPWHLDCAVSLYYPATWNHTSLYFLQSHTVQAANEMLAKHIPPSLFCIVPALFHCHCVMGSTERYLHNTQLLASIFVCMLFFTVPSTKSTKTYFSILHYTAVWSLRPSGLFSLVRSHMYVDTEILYRYTLCPIFSATQS